MYLSIRNLTKILYLHNTTDLTGQKCELNLLMSIDMALRICYDSVGHWLLVIGRMN